MLPMASILPISKKEVKKQEAENEVFPMPSSLPPISSRKKRSPSLQFDEIKSILTFIRRRTIAKNMNVGLTLLRKMKLKITRWPY